MANILVDILWWAAYIGAAFGAVAIIGEVVEGERRRKAARLSEEEKSILFHLNNINNRY